MPKPNKRILTIILERKWWELIRDGLKPVEYRRVVPHWYRLLWNREYDEVHFVWGYPAAAKRAEFTLRRKWESVWLQCLTHEAFGPKDIVVFAIRVGEKIEQEEEASDEEEA